MRAVRTYLSNSILNPFFFRPSFARVISGEEEGVFGWLAVNQLQCTLLRSRTERWGALDLGGASTQITFAPNDDLLAGLFPLSFWGSYNPLYTHSYLRYGINEFTLKLVISCF